MINRLPTELINQILLLLPPSEYLRMVCVNKFFNDLIIMSKLLLLSRAPGCNSFSVYRKKLHRTLGIESIWYCYRIRFKGMCESCKGRGWIPIKIYENQGYYITHKRCNGCYATGRKNYRGCGQNGKPGDSGFRLV